jgi:hypothetical protein
MLTPAPGRAVRMWLMVLLLLAIAVQFYFAGRGAFGAASYKTHKDFGGVIHIATAIILIATIAIPATRNRIDIGLAVLLVVLMEVQFALGDLKHPDAGAFHPVNALLLLALAWAMFQRDRAPAVGPGPTAPS